MKKDLHSYIVTRLGRAASEDDVIYSVCHETGLDWEQARALVEQVKNEHLDEIDARQLPMKSALSSVFYLLGIALVVGPVIYLWIMLDVTRTFLVLVSNPSTVDAETAFKLLGSRCALLGWFELPSIFFTMLVGVGIIGTNVRYMSGIWENLFSRWNMSE